METKSNHNLEKTRLTNFMTGFLYISGITLAAFSYGKNKPIEYRKISTNFDNNTLVVDANQKPKEVIPSIVKPLIKQSVQKSQVIDLQNPKPTNENVSDDIKVDLGLIKGDTTVIVRDNPIDVISTNNVEDFPDVEAEYPGGYNAWKEYLLSELKYPDISLEMGEQGIVYISFVVEIDGSIGEVKVIKGVSFNIDREAKRVIKNSNKWIPGRINKVSVRTRMTIPINFIID